MKTKKLFQVMLIVLAAVMLFTACSANSSAPSEALTGCWVHLSDKEEDIAILQFFPNGSVITTTYNNGHSGKVGPWISQAQSYCATADGALMIDNIVCTYTLEGDRLTLINGETRRELTRSNKNTDYYKLFKPSDVAKSKSLRDLVKP